MKFPCGTKGRPEFCPDLCQYGKFCKVKEKKEELNPPAEKLIEETDEPQEDVKVEAYY